MFKILKGQKKSDGTLIETQEAEKFNRECPEFFSEGYENARILRLKKRLLLGFLVSGSFLTLVMKTY